jgi:uroporphyrinogen-III synthase
MTILLTKALPQSNLDLINSFGWKFDIINALDIALVDVNNLPDDKADAWIISSRNSLAVVQKFILQVPPIIYCIGHWMGSELKKIFPPSQIFTYKKMKDLVVRLQKQNHKHLLYFCADNHRGELEEGLTGTPSIITKLTTHESRMTNPKLSKNYDAVFVFSPRSAESLLKNNSFSAKTIFACIGPTTVSYLNEHSIDNTFQASYPETEILMKEFHTHITNTPS